MRIKIAFSLSKPCPAIFPWAFLLARSEMQRLVPSLTSRLFCSRSHTHSLVRRFGPSVATLKVNLGSLCLLGPTLNRFSYLACNSRSNFTGSETSSDSEESDSSHTSRASFLPASLLFFLVFKSLPEEEDKLELEQIEKAHNLLRKYMGGGLNLNIDYALIPVEILFCLKMFLTIVNHFEDITEEEKYELWKKTSRTRILAINVAVDDICQDIDQNTRQTSLDFIKEKFTSITNPRDLNRDALEDTAKVQWFGEPILINLKACKRGGEDEDYIILLCRKLEQSRSTVLFATQWMNELRFLLEEMHRVKYEMNQI